MDKVETVARAICASDFDGDETVFDTMSLAQQDNFRINARAAIAALTGAEAAPDARPTNCRFRLQDEGKGYPKSGCHACNWRMVGPCPHTAPPPSRAEAPDAARIVKALRDIAERKADEINRHPGARTRPQELVEWEAADLIERQEAAIRKLEGTT